MKAVITFIVLLFSVCWLVKFQIIFCFPNPWTCHVPMRSVILLNAKQIAQQLKQRCVISRSQLWQEFHSGIILLPMMELLALMSTVLFQRTLATVYKFRRLLYCSNRSSVRRNKINKVSVVSIAYGLGSNPEVVTCSPDWSSLCLSESSSPRVKRQGHEADLSTPFNVEVKNSPLCLHALVLN